MQSKKLNKNTFEQRDPHGAAQPQYSPPPAYNPGHGQGGQERLDRNTSQRRAPVGQPRSKIVFRGDFGGHDVSYGRSYSPLSARIVGCFLMLFAVVPTMVGLGMPPVMVIGVAAFSFFALISSLHRRKHWANQNL